MTVNGSNWQEKQRKDYQELIVLLRKRGCLHLCQYADRRCLGLFLCSFYLQLLWLVRLEFYLHETKTGKHVWKVKSACSCKVLEIWIIKQPDYISNDSLWATSEQQQELVVKPGGICLQMFPLKDEEPVTSYHIQILRKRNLQLIFFIGFIEKRSRASLSTARSVESTCQPDPT